MVTVTAALATVRHLLEHRPSLRIVVVDDLRDWQWIIYGDTIYVDGQQPGIATAIYDAAMHLILEAGDDNVVPLVPVNTATG